MKIKNKKKKWEETGAGNEILEAKWGRVSYNPNTNSYTSTILAGIVNAIEPARNVNNGEETALFADNTWMILSGDFRKEYEGVFPNKEKCIAVYKKNIRYRNNWSSDDPPNNQ